MANIVPNSFKGDLLKGVFNFDSSGGSTFYCALYTSLAGFSTSTTTYTGTSNEVGTSGTNYSTGGNVMTNFGVTVGTTSYVDFDDVTFSSVTLNAVGALIYKDSVNKEAVLVLDFGGTKTATNGDFVIQFPTADSSNAIIRLGDA